jgi:hypothetical protein
MMGVESYRAKEASHQHLSQQAEPSLQSAEMIAIGGPK